MSHSDFPAAPSAPIELQIRKIEQLFHTLDPTPYRERDLDADVESYVVNWARELPARRALRILIYLPARQAAREEATQIADAVRNYFAYRAETISQELKELFRIGRISLLIGLAVLAACSLAAGRLMRLPGSPYWTRLFAEGLLILGWVANWRPIEVILYDWWPMYGRRRLYRRLARADIVLRSQDGDPKA